MYNRNVFDQMHVFKVNLTKIAVKLFPA